jgi:hypothetical protein
MYPRGQTRTECESAFFIEAAVRAYHIERAPIIPRIALEECGAEVWYQTLFGQCFANNIAVPSGTSSSTRLSIRYCWIARRLRLADNGFAGGSMPPGPTAPRPMVVKVTDVVTRAHGFVSTIRRYLRRLYGKKLIRRIQLPRARQPLPNFPQNLAPPRLARSLPICRAMCGARHRIGLSRLGGRHAKFAHRIRPKFIKRCPQNWRPKATPTLRGSDGKRE